MKTITATEAKKSFNHIIENINEEPVTVTRK